MISCERTCNGRKPVGNKVNPNWQSYESKKNAYLQRHLVACFAGCQINPNDVNFHLKKKFRTLEKFGKNSDPKRTGGEKCPTSCQLRLR